jgi:hypothetical protein
MFVHFVGFLYLDTIPFQSVCLSIVGDPEIKTPTMDKHTNLKGMVSRYKKPTKWTNILT